METSIYAHASRVNAACGNNDFLNLRSRAKGVAGSPFSAGSLRSGVGKRAWSRAYREVNAAPSDGRKQIVTTPSGTIASEVTRCVGGTGTIVPRGERWSRR